MSKNEGDHIADLKETFANLREAGLKLNPEKCVFDVSIGEMLGVHHRTRRYKGQPRQNEGHNLNGGTINQKGSPKTHRKNSSAEQIHLKLSRT